MGKLSTALVSCGSDWFALSRSNAPSHSKNKDSHHLLSPASTSLTMCQVLYMHFLILVAMLWSRQQPHEDCKPAEKFREEPKKGQTPHQVKLQLPKEGHNIKGEDTTFTFFITAVVCKSSPFSYRGGWEAWEASFPPKHTTSSHQVSALPRWSSLFPHREPLLISGN